MCNSNNFIVHHFLGFNRLISSDLLISETSRLMSIRSVELNLKRSSKLNAH